MGFGDDEEILQDFLVEAGEIIELLSEQLVDLEQRPDDKDLLNAIFRGFHTVKGGAGFLQLNAMVECCHITENLFDILRNGKRSVTPELMDVVLQALDTVTEQFSQLSSGDEPVAADPSLIQRLAGLVSCDDIEGVTTSKTDQSSDISENEFESFLDAIDDEQRQPAATSPADQAQDSGTSGSVSDEITDDEFDALLDQLHGAGKGPTAKRSEPKTVSEPNSATSGSDDISEEEFERLLDQLHGAGNSPGTTTSSSASATTSSHTINEAPHAATTSPLAGESDHITDEEFEALLDQLHGKGKGPVERSSSSTPMEAAPEPSPASGVSTDKPNEKTGAKPTSESTPKPQGAASILPSVKQDFVKKDVPAETTVRVDTQRLDDIMNMVGELVLVRNRLVRLGLETSDEPMQKAVANLDVVTGDLQSAVMKTRMQPIKKVFGRFPRVVRDLARNLNKEISLELQGEETDLDKNLVEALADPLVHLVRNSVDHGIEQPDVRELNGKPREGTVVLAAQQEGDHILLSISDDGAGMDPDALRAKAVEKGILDVDAAQRLSDVETFNLIFAPGFSTKSEISDVSGRGVGMDVVKTKITQLNGSIEIDSKVGAGTCFVIKVPLTLAIMPTLMILLGNQTFALPLASVNEIFNMDLAKSNVVDGQECISIRDKAIPMFYLKQWLVKATCAESVDSSEGHVVIVSVGTQRVGFVVDQLIGQEEVVIKPLGKMLQGTPGMAGATITGDGTIALILDVPSMLKRYVG